ncbi:hypothetical protein J6590_101810 [Homalodisca vitripennis]|nr:hypothetical protein J6590_101810 [Homalodisca vitripennis]
METTENKYWKVINEMGWQFIYRSARLGNLLSYWTTAPPGDFRNEILKAIYDVLSVLTSTSHLLLA